MRLKPARAGAMAFALTTLPAAAANDSFLVNGAPIAATATGGYLPATAAYFPNGLFSASNPGYVQGSLATPLLGFAPAGAYAALAVSTTSANVALPTGATIVVYNTGANAAFLQLGAAGVTATTSGDVVQPGGALALSVGSNAYLAAVTANGATSLNISGGAGLPAGWGGASGGGAVAQGAAGSSAWLFAPYQGGSAVGASNGLFVQPGAGSIWTLGPGAATIGAISNTSFGISGTLPAFAATPTFNLGAAPTLSVQWSGQSVAATQASGPWTQNVTQFGGSNIVTGTGASGAGVPRVTVSSDSVHPVSMAGSTGTDNSVNKPALPNVGANFAGSGPYANYALVATAPANAARKNIDIENVSGAQIAIVRDDGTASPGAQPANASVFALGGGSSAGAQGGSWSSQTFQGRIQVYAPSSTAIVSIFQD